MVRSFIARCVRCRYLRGKVGEQKMADLPAERISAEPPITYAGLDMLGPFMVKHYRKKMKRHGVIFTCLSSRAAHLEAVQNMETDSFIQALRRFIARRGNIRLINFDNGTNFVGAKSELQRSLSEMDEDKISHFLQNGGTDWVTCKNNPQSGSHMGGVWERQIKSARVILSALLKQQGTSLNDESLITLLTEVESVVNSRPLTVETFSDIGSEAPLNPINLLTMKSSVVLPSPGDLKQPHLYSRRRWRRIQHIAKEFWCRWRKEFLATLQSRAKWQRIKRNFKIGDIVLLKSNTIRIQWPIAKFVDVYKSNYGHVRTVKLRVGDNKFNVPRNIWSVRFTRFSYCSKTMRFDSPTEKQMAYIIKMMNHLEGSHVLMVESCEL